MTLSLCRQREHVDGRRKTIEWRTPKEKSSKMDCESSPANDKDNKTQSDRLVCVYAIVRMPNEITFSNRIMLTSANAAKYVYVLSA